MWCKKLTKWLLRTKLCACNWNFAFLFYGHQTRLLMCKFDLLVHIGIVTLRFTMMYVYTVQDVHFPNTTFVA